MPDLVLVPAEVLPGPGATYTYGAAGVAVSATNLRLQLLNS